MHVSQTSQEHNGGDIHPHSACINIPTSVEFIGVRVAATCLPAMQRTWHSMSAPFVIVDTGTYVSGAWASPPPDFPIRDWEKEQAGLCSVVGHAGAVCMRVAARRLCFLQRVSCSFFPVGFKTQLGVSWQDFRIRFGSSLLESSIYASVEHGCVHIPLSPLHSLPTHTIREPGADGRTDGRTDGACRWQSFQVTGPQTSAIRDF